VDQKKKKNSWSDFSLDFDCLIHLDVRFLGFATLRRLERVPKIVSQIGGEKW